ncbi:PREDICTED: NFX1-type zinc finger-containing protein 1-like [Amphimedon queenslandica]|uniref:RZ-type domain-containing protein n=1 Tax=Amphimedon queenslandica TaxID=400682 RepID=A0A1X7UL79_AMPQE|nr:PREDICTED: NFX1-type zinc finger-containing protein 1-like [Amphimedon queenslandica]|eukprot:XP_003387579.1 PREDICTED: NFX1-type zinc finger-containing protein 1-like [Amphimedon queenslandica]
MSNKKKPGQLKRPPSFSDIYGSTKQIKISPENEEEKDLRVLLDQRKELGPSRECDIDMRESLTRRITRQFPGGGYDKSHKTATNDASLCFPVPKSTSIDRPGRKRKRASFNPHDSEEDEYIATKRQQFDQRLTGASPHYYEKTTASTPHFHSIQASSNSSKDRHPSSVPSWCDTMAKYLKLSAKDVVSCESVLNDIHDCFVDLIHDINANGIHNKEGMILKAIKMLAIMCQNLTSDDMISRDHTEGALSYKLKIFDDIFLPFWATLGSFTRSLPYYKVISKFDFISSLQQVLMALLYSNAFPIHKVVQFLPLDDLHGALKQLCDSSSRDFKILYEQSLQLLTKRDNLRSSLIMSNAHDDTFTLLPSRSDLMSTSILVKNKPQYSSDFEYLETHFELLRQDFIRPLCDVLRNLQEENEEYYEDNNGYSSAITYESVRFNNKDVCGGDLVYKINFHLPKGKKVNWDHSKRLTYGSLLCLSNDNFHTLLFATVANRDAKELKRGIIAVKVLDASVERISDCLKYKMIESPAYFEAYSSVVKQLHAMKSNPENNLPDLAKKYLVKGEAVVEMPLYAQIQTNEERHYILDLKGVLCDCKTIRECPHGYNSIIVSQTKFTVSEAVEEFQVEISNSEDEMSDNEDETSLVDTVVLPNSSLNSSSDSSDNEMEEFLTPVDNFQDSQQSKPPFAEKLDESQVAALRLALSSEVALIQGPPGTGKTFIGVQFVKAMLQNRRKWNSEKSVPILVMCQTNHALDQFLEEILDLKISKNLVRIGGRSKSERISNEKLNIRDKKRQIRLYRKFIVPRRRSQQAESIIFPSLFFRKEDLTLIKCKYDALEELCYKGLPYNELNKMLYYSFLHPKQLFSCTSDCAIHDYIKGMRSIEDILQWLGIESNSPKTPKKSPCFLTDFYTDSEEDERKIDADEDRNAELEGEEVLSAAKNKRDLVNFFKKLQRSDPDEARVQRYQNQLRLDQKRDLLKMCLRNQCRHLRQELRILQEKKKKFEDEDDAITLQALKEADIVGVTTTGASMNIKVLQKVRSKIVVVEEAAEVMEGHIVAALTKHIQHLVLIGDHKQLRPKANDFTIGRKHGLEISLFERLIKNGLSSVQLKYQHRMRPEIAKLVCPHIYRELLDHQKVLNYEPVKGIKTNMFFVSHTFSEQPMEGLMSPANSHEADFVVRLAKYLLTQGYKPDQLTILTPYTGQVACIKERMKTFSFESSPRIVPIDNFQGEENDIVILSLVRSVKSGFMKEENRICVALSRAKKGLYVIGNFELFTKESRTWKTIINSLDSNFFGFSLPLQCHLHKTITDVKLPVDFDKVKDGGCLELCCYRMACGHVCPRRCHPDDLEHKQKCLKQCSRKICSFDHPCPRLCSEKCPPCKELVLKIIPSCNHQQLVPCHWSPNLFTCLEECIKMLECGHRCKRRCGEKCTNYQCRELVMKMLPCGHEAQTECFREPKDYMRRCKIPCNVELACGHLCRGTCGECNQGRLHIPCKEKCTRILLCGHKCSSNNCASDCPPCRLNCPSSCIHGPCGHKCTSSCIPCAEPCEWQCPHHKCTKICGDICDRPRCNEPCQLKLQCGHPCLGLCHEPCPPVCRVCDPKNEAFSIFLGNESEPESRFIMPIECSHIFEVSDLDTYMDMNDDHNAVQWKRCPRCSTNITKSLRYGNVIKKIKTDMNAIKMKEFQTLNGFDRDKMKRDILGWNDKIKYCNIRHINDLPDVTLQSLHTLLSSATECVELLQMFDTGSDCSDIICISKQISRLQSFLRSHRVKNLQCLPQQVINDIQCEIRRFHFLRKFFEVDIKPKSSLVHYKWITYERQIEELNLTSYKPNLKMTEEIYKEKCENLSWFCRENGLDAPTPEEIRQIVAAMGGRKGSWYKCPNGHYYHIGECGGAMQVGKCIECDAQVGGSSHRLLDDNQHAGEMDDSRFAAWGQEANLNNYDLNDVL